MILCPLGTLADSGDTVLLVMPQDRQAPKGRLILPRYRPFGNCLTKTVLYSVLDPGRFPDALAGLKKPPELIVTDS